MLLIPENSVRRLAGGQLLPPATDNLFSRIIRNPFAGSASLRERQCAEMLASLLINAPSACRQLCRHFAEISGIPRDVVDQCEFSIDTEQSIGRKRDDLRIEGRPKSNSYGERWVLWTIEIKVGAYFHLSSDATVDGPSEEEELKNQLVNYHHWLMGQRDCRYKAGLVLALEDLTNDLGRDVPEILSHWKCLTWTTLGVILRDFILTETAIPAEEQFLCRHVLGFIAQYLWRSAEMPDSRIDFEDVAMLRAWAIMADECESKVKKLVDPLADLIAGFPIGSDPDQRDNLFSRRGRYAKGKVIGGKKDPGLELWAGVAMDRGDEGAKVYVWLESAPRSPLKFALHSFCRRLEAVNGRWETGNPYWDACLSMPLTELLVAENQQERIQKFVKDALSDLLKAELDKVLA
jgi:hypothetical protein